MRAFVGLPLPWAIADALSRRAGGAGVGRAVAADDLHLTLSFLGDQGEGHLSDLHEGLSLIRAPALTLRWGPPDFLDSGNGGAFVLTVAEEAGLTHLHQRVRAAARLAGIALPHNRFRPHVTLIRLGKHIDPAAQARLQGLILRGLTQDISPAAVDRVVLYRSHLDRAGAWYETLAEYPLGGADGLDGVGDFGP